MSSVPPVAEAMRYVLNEVSTALARATGFCQRRSKVTAALFVQTLVVGWLAHPTGTLHQLTQIMAGLKLKLSAQGLMNRFTPEAATLLEQVLAAAVGVVVQAEPVAVALLAKFPAVVLLDSTTIGLPDELAAIWAGCGGRHLTNTQAALKLSVRLDLRTGALDGPTLSAGRAQDRSSPMQTAPLPPGALRVADLGYWSVANLGEIATQGAFFLSRLHGQPGVFTSAGERLEVVTWLTKQRRRRMSLDVTLGVDERLPARLVAIPLPGRVAKLRRERLRKAGKTKGETPSAFALATVGWTMLVTNGPASQLSFAEAMVLARARWQIELLFKLWKNEGRVDEWRTTKPWRILCEVYAKLIAMVIQHWLLLVGCWVFTDRSLTQAAQTIRSHTIPLALTLRFKGRLADTIRTIRSCLTAGCRVTTRRTRPNLFQLLANPTIWGLA